MQKKFISVSLFLLLFIPFFTVLTYAALGSFKVTFDLNYDGTVSESVSVGSGECAADIMPEDPVRTGFGFNGWYLEKECINEFDANEPLTGDLTVYASWKQPLEYCDAENNVYVCERYKEITPERTEFNCSEDAFITFADGCAETGSISLNGDVTYKLILKDGQSVNAREISLGNGTSIEIYGQTEGNGNLSLSSQNAAIGAHQNVICGDITINGGIIQANTFYGACIGTSTSRMDIFGKYPSGCGDITINGGTIIAQSSNGACIGSGYANDYNSFVGKITINGGTLDLTNHSGACIGTGSADHGAASCGDITINGGIIRMSTHISSAIGVGDTEKGHMICGDLLITGGTLFAEGYFGYPIGGVNNLTISGGTIIGSNSVFGAVRVHNNIRITGGNITFMGCSSDSSPLIQCAGSEISDDLSVICGQSELETDKTDRIDLPGINYLRIRSLKDLFDEYEFSADSHSFTATDKKDGSILVLNLPEERYVYDGKPHGPQFSTEETLEWIDKIGILPSVYYTLSDGYTPTDKNNSGADCNGGLPVKTGSYLCRAELKMNDTDLSLSIHFFIIEQITVPFSQTEITIKVGETNDSITYSGPIASYLEVFDLSDYDVINAKADHNHLKLIITGKSVGTSQIQLRPISTYGFETVDFLIPEITVHVIDGSSPPQPGGNTPRVDPSVNTRVWGKRIVLPSVIAVFLLGAVACFVLIRKKRK